MERKLLNDSSFTITTQNGRLVYIFDKKQHAQTILHNLIVMQDNEEGSLTEVIITSNEDEEFHFHAPVLAALSKTLKEKLRTQGLGSSASRSSKIVMKEAFSSEALKCLWDYAYTSIVALTSSNISEVMELAQHYGLDSLLKKCKELADREDFGEDADNNKEEIEFKDLPEMILDRLHNFLQQNVLCTAAITDFFLSSRYPCHGAMIAAACTDFYSELVFGDSNKMIEVNQHAIQAIEPFLQFLYSAQLTIDKETVQPLIVFAVKFNIPSLVNACCHLLKFIVTAENALGIKAIAQALRNNDVNVQNDASISDALDDLYQYSRSFILRNFLLITELEEYIAISLGELFDLVIDDNLMVHSEEEVVSAIVKWVCCSIEERADDLPILLQAVRLEYIPPDFLEAMLEHDLIIRDSFCIQILENAKSIRMPSGSRRRSTVQQYDVE